MKEFKLFSHNQKALREIEKTYESGENIASIIQATGTGKAFIALALAIKNYPSKVVFIEPKISIIEHIKSIIDEYGLKDRINVDFITYQQLAYMEKKQFDSIKYNYLVVDEFHHTGAPIWGAKVKELIEKHPESKTLGMSAYSVRDNGTHYAMDVAPNKNEINEEEELPIFANSVVNRYNLTEAIADGVLPYPIYIGGSIKLLNYLDEIADKIKKSTASEEEKKKYFTELNKIRPSLLKNGYTKSLIKDNLTDKDKVIYFVPKGKIEDKRIIDETAKELRELFPSAEIYSTTSDDINGKRNRELFYQDKNLQGEDVSQKLRIMVAIDQYNEGNHVPGVNKVVMGRGTQSDIVFFEQLGRCLSVANETMPVCLDLAGNFDFIMDLSEEITNIQKQRYVEKGVKIDINRKVCDFFQLNSSFIEIKNKLDMYYQRFENWELNLKKLQEFLKENKRYPSVKSEDEQEKRLGNWVGTQRKLKNKQEYQLTEIDKKRIELLNSIGFVWGEKSEEIFDQKWQEKLNSLIQFVQEKGRYPSWKLEDEQEKRLWKWISHQRELKNKQEDQLTEIEKGRIELLNSIGFVWKERSEEILDQKWQEKLNSLIQFVQEKGRYPSWKSEDEQEKRLVKWISHQRELKNKQEYQLTEIEKRRIELLNSIGFVWEEKSEEIFDQKWQEKLNNFIQFFQEKGKYPSAESKDEQEKKLGKWIGHQRGLKNKQEYQLTEIEKRRIELLNSIGFVWKVIVYDEKTGQYINMRTGKVQAPNSKNKSIEKQPCDDEDI